MSRTLFILVVGVFVIIYPSCKLIKPNAAQQASKTSDKDIKNLKLKFYNANKEKLLGNYDLSTAYFYQCLKIAKEHTASMYEIADIYSLQGRYAEALPLLKKAVSIEPQNKWYHIALAGIYQKDRQFDKAVDVYKNLTKEYPNNIDYYYEWASALILDDQHKEAIAVYDKVEEKIGITEELSLIKERLYIKLGDVNKAISEVQKLITAQPDEPKYYEELANLYQAKGMNVQALETYQKILKINPDYPYYHLSLSNYYRNIGDKEKSFFEMKLAFSNPDLDIDTKIQILLSYYSISEKYDTLKTQAFALCQILVKTHPKEAKSHAMYADFLNREEKYEEARGEFRKAIEYDSSIFEIWRQLLLIESDLRDFNAMLDESKKAMELFPNQPSFYLFNGAAHLQKKQYHEAIESLINGKELVIANDLLLLQFYSNLGDAYNRVKNYPQSDSAYEMALTIDSNHVNILNNYSYYLSLRGEKLERAERMSEKSNELAPDVPSYQDTYGWILYKIGKYHEAKIWIDKALGKEKNNSVILEHYGDILYQLGDKEGAYNYWQKAKEKGSGSELLDKKIADRKLYE